DVQIDRERAAALGVSVTDIGSTLQTMLGGQRATRFKRGNHQYDVILQVPRAGRAAPDVIRSLYVRGAHGPVQLASVVNVREGVIHPLTILMSVPLAVFGAVVTLWLFHATINIYSQIGLIMLIGLVTKNAILIVEYSNQRRARGEPLMEAAIAAAKIRVRPIIMTTLATIFGIMPIALGLGAGAESRKPLGMAVVGGMILSTALT